MQVSMNNSLKTGCAMLPWGTKSGCTKSIFSRLKKDMFRFFHPAAAFPISVCLLPEGSKAAAQHLYNFEQFSHSQNLIFVSQTAFDNFLIPVADICSALNMFNLILKLVFLLESWFSRSGTHMNLLINYEKRETILISWQFVISLHKL